MNEGFSNKQKSATYLTRTSASASVIMTGSERSRRAADAPAKDRTEGSIVTTRFFGSSDCLLAVVVVFVFVVVGCGSTFTCLV